MKCIHCGKNPREHGVVLVRQNEKRVDGVWACESCSEKPLDEDIALVVAQFQKNVSTGSLH